MAHFVGSHHFFVFSSSVPLRLTLGSILTLTPWTERCVETNGSSPWEIFELLLNLPDVGPELRKFLKCNTGSGGELR